MRPKDSDKSLPLSRIYINEFGEIILNTEQTVRITAKNEVSIDSPSLKVSGNAVFKTGQSGIFVDMTGQLITVTNGLITEMKR